MELMMKAPKGANPTALIDGHEYKIGKDGVIKVVQAHHEDTLRRHGFTPHHVNPVDVLEQIEAMTEKEELVEFIEERGGDADTGMSLKKLKRLAVERVDTE